MSAKRKCLSCKTSLKGMHLNQKRCKPCAKKVREKPIGKLTPEQEFKVYALMGTMFIKDLADHIGTSKSNLVRWARDRNIKLDALSYPKNIVEQVIKYYEKHGKVKTQEKFPDIKVRSIVERYKHKPRQIRWNGKQKIELVKMSGFISKKDQARYFNRPRANGGSITSAWQKTLKIKAANVKVGFHVVSNYKIRRFLKKSCPTIPVSNPAVSKAYLWHDVNKHLKKSAPQIMKDTAKAIAEFQEWLYDSKNPRKEILKMIKGRTVSACNPQEKEG